MADDKKLLAWPQVQKLWSMIKTKFAKKDVIKSSDYTAEMGSTYIHTASCMVTVPLASSMQVGDWFKIIVASGGGTVQDTNSSVIGRMNYNGTYLYIVLDRSGSKLWHQYSI